MNGKKKSNSIKRYMLRSYLIMTVIAILLESISMVYLLKNTHSYINVKHNSQLNRVVSGVDKDLQNIVTQCNVLSQNDKVINILRINLVNEYYGEQMEKVYTVMNLFDDMLKYYDILESLSYWDVKQDTVITNKAIFHREEYTDYFFSKLYLSVNDIEQLMSSSKDQFFLVNEGTSQCKLYCISRIYLSSYNQPDGILFGEISMDYLSETFTMDSETNDEVYLLMTNDGGLISTEPMDMAEKITADGKMHGEYTFNNRSYVYSSEESAMLPFKYCYARYYYSFYSIIFVALGIIILNIGVLIIVSLILARRFSDANTKPLRQIYGLVNDQIDEETLTYDDIYESVSGLNIRLQDLESENEKDAFSMIMLGQKKDKDILQEYEQRLQSEIKDGYYVICVKILNLSQDSDHEVLMFCLQNIFRELLESNLIESPVEVWNRTYFVLKCTENHAKDQIIKGMRFLEERLSMTVCVGASCVKDSVVQLEQARWEADCMMEYAELAGVSYHPVYMQKVLESTDKKSFDRDIIKKIMNCISSGLYDEARALLQKMDPTGDGLNYSNVKEMRRYMLTILSIVSIPYRERIALINMEKYQNYTVKELFYANMQMLLDLSSGVETKNTSNANIDKIKQYIDEHISDMNMNVGAISEEFNLTPSYLSKLFKKDSGEGVLDYIHKSRIRVSKDLLLQGKSVQEVAIKVGYIDARGYIRAFKRYEGITPGMFKESKGM